jgi:hypothetical protein
MKTKIVLLLISVACAFLTSCGYPVYRGQQQGQQRSYHQESYGDLGGQMGPGGRSLNQDQGQRTRHLDSITVRKVRFQASVDSRYANRRQKVSNYASTYFEQNHGQIVTNQQVSQHFGFKCEVRQVGQIQKRTIEPGQAPANIQAMFQ